MGIQAVNEMLAFDQLSAFDAEVEERKRLVKNSIYLGVPALDHAFKSLLPNDFVILAAKTGSGKTELLTTMGMNMAAKGKRVSLFALEASKYEIHRRIKFKVLSELYREETGKNDLSYSGWIRFAYEDRLKPYQQAASEKLKVIAKNLSLYYRSGEFNVRDFLKMYHKIYKSNDCILADHAHFFAKSSQHSDSEHMRDLALNMYDTVNKFECPILMAAHLRKVENERQFADENDVYGASELVKAATRIMIICRGEYRADMNGYETVFRITKNREESPTALQVMFSQSNKKYSDDFVEGQIIRDEFISTEQMLNLQKRR